MIKPDIIISWPRNCDYPLFREFIRLNRTQFNQVNIVFTGMKQPSDYSGFVREDMFADWCLFIESPEYTGREDWRNVSVNEGLRHSLHSEWVLFLEQDFFMKPGFWEAVQGMAIHNDVIAVLEGDRMHPAFLMMKRTILNKTSKNFGAQPPEYDHFGQIYRDLYNMEKENQVKIKYIDRSLWLHMAGLSQNWYLLSSNQQPNYKLDEFEAYLMDCLEASEVKLHPTFIELATKYLNG